MFENLTEKLQRTFKNLRGQGKLTDEHLNTALAEIRDALLEGDVNVGVADELLVNIRAKAIGSEVMLQLSPDQQVVKVVRDELAAMLGKYAKPLFCFAPAFGVDDRGPAKVPVKPRQQESSRNGFRNMDIVPGRFHRRLPARGARTARASCQSRWRRDLAWRRDGQAARNCERRH